MHDFVRSLLLCRNRFSCSVKPNVIALQIALVIRGDNHHDCSCRTFSSSSSSSSPSAMWNLRIPPKINAQWIYVQKDAEIKTHFKKRGRMIYERERLQVREHGQSPEVIKYKFKARQLLNLELYSVGSFRNEPEYKDARQVFFQLLKELKAYDEEAVTLCFRLVRRLLEELRARPNASQEQWICDPEFLLIEILVAWKKASVAGEHVYTALQVIEMMDENATIVKSFRLDAPATALIVFVIARLVDANGAPMLTGKVLTLYWKDRGALAKKNVQRNRSLWNKLLFTWAKSNSHDAPRTLKMILRRMYETPEITTNTASYNIVLQFFANKGMVKEVEETMDLMKQHGIRQDLLMLSEAVTAFLITKNMDRAEEFLDMMISKLQNNTHARHQQRLVPEVLRKIFVAYQELLKEANASVVTKEELFDRAFALFQRVQKSECPINLTQDFVVEEVMSIAALAEKPETVEELACSVQELNCKMWNTRILALATKTPDRATSVLDQMVKVSTHNPTISTINKIMAGWAESQKQDAFKNAFEILKRMNSDPDYDKLPFHPNRETYNLLLKTLSQSCTVSNPGRIAGLILDSMKECAEITGADVKPNSQSIKYAIRCCLAADDTTRAEQFLDQLEYSEVEQLELQNPFVEILQYWAEKDTDFEFDKMYRILCRWREFWKAHAADSQPKMTFNNAAAGGFRKLRTSTAEDRLWMLYEQSLHDDVDIDGPFHNVLVGIFSLSTSRVALERAERILQRLKQKGFPTIHNHCLADAGEDSIQ